jgi:hypothetical protein
LPGNSFDAIDINRLHDLVRRDGMTLRAAARKVDVPLDVVRLLFEEHPAPAVPRRPPQTTITVRLPGPAYQRAAEVLSRERFVELYEVERRSLRDIAAMVGVCRPTVAQLARDYGITLRQPCSPKIHNIDRDWLYAEYITKQRSLSDLASERGITVSCISQRAKSYGIPVRGPRWRNASELAEKPDVPAVLAPALIGQGGWERLQRFADVAAYRSYTEAENALRISHATLGQQIMKLHRDLGRPIVIPATGHKPLRLTRLGKQVLAAVHELAERGGP